jgi:hypothetical protein
VSTVENLKFLREREECKMSFAHIRLHNPVLIHEPDPKDELTVVCEVSFREDTIEKSWAQPIKI